MEDGLIFKIGKSPYVDNGLTQCHGIWRDDAH